MSEVLRMDHGCLEQRIDIRRRNHHPPNVGQRKTAIQLCCVSRSRPQLSLCVVCVACSFHHSTSTFRFIRSNINKPPKNSSLYMPPS